MDTNKYDKRFLELLDSPMRFVMGKEVGCYTCYQKIQRNEKFLDNGQGRYICMKCTANMTAAIAMEKDAHYLQESGSIIGNSVVWWRKGNKGYTSDIAEAEVYSKEDAFAQHACRETDIPWPKMYVDTKIKKHVDMQYLDTISNKEKIAEMKKCTE